MKLNSDVPQCQVCRLESFSIAMEHGPTKAARDLAKKRVKEVMRVITTKSSIRYCKPCSEDHRQVMAYLRRKAFVDARRTLKERWDAYQFALSEFMKAEIRFMEMLQNLPSDDPTLRVARIKLRDKKFLVSQRLRRFKEAEDKYHIRNTLAAYHRPTRNEPRNDFGGELDNLKLGD